METTRHWVRSRDGIRASRGAAKDDEGNARMLGPGERLPSPNGEREAIRRDIQSSRARRIGGVCPRRRCKRVRMIGEPVCYLHAAFEDPASTSRPMSGLNGADGGQQHSTAETGEPNSTAPNQTTAIGRRRIPLRREVIPTSVLKSLSLRRRRAQPMTRHWVRHFGLKEE